MILTNGICSCCLKHLPNVRLMLACELSQIQCNKTIEEAEFCEISKCKFHFDEDGYFGCDEFIFCNDCYSDHSLVLKTIENYIEVCDKGNQNFPDIAN